MIRKNGQYNTELRPEMRGGTGTVKIEHLLDEAGELRGLNRLFARLTLEPGTSIGFHEHVGEAEVFVVISGTGEIDDNGVKSTVAAGDTIQVKLTCKSGYGNLRENGNHGSGVSVGVKSVYNLGHDGDLLTGGFINLSY